MAKTNLEILRAVGSLLYGEYWQKQMAEHLGVAQRTMNRWETGVHGVPDMLPDGSGFVERMLEALEDRKGALDELIKDVEEAMPDARPGTQPYPY